MFIEFEYISFQPIFLLLRRYFSLQLLYSNIHQSTLITIRPTQDPRGIEENGIKAVEDRGNAN